MMKLHKITAVPAFVAAAVLSACASAPTRNDQLEQARATVQNLAQDPYAERAANEQLRSAQASLKSADAAMSRHASPAEVNHLAFLAERQAQTGLARADEARAREQVAKGETERNRILLQARTQEAQAAKMQAEQAQASAQSAQQQLKDLQARQTDRGMVLTLGDVLFDTGQATLKPGANLELDRIGQYLQKSPQTHVIIEGHTDSRGSAEYNEELSQRRAQAVAASLSERGISPDRIQAVGRGKDFPVASNDTPSGRQQNRRVEIVFSDASGHFAAGASSGAALR
jgi:outer membrane protein OmpA-like peptidoglycan-associated protein